MLLRRSRTRERELDPLVDLVTAGSNEALEHLAITQHLTARCGEQCFAQTDQLVRSTELLGEEELAKLLDREDRRCGIPGHPAGKRCLLPRARRRCSKIEAALWM